MPRKQPRQYRKVRRYRGYRVGGSQMMNRMGGVMVDTARLSLGFGALSAIITTSQGLGGK
jgi:hypothetical protein